MKNLYGGMDANIMIIQLTLQDKFFLKITRTVDFNGKPFEDGNKWAQEPVIAITEAEAMNLFHSLGVPIRVNPPL